MAKCIPLTYMLDDAKEQSWRRLLEQPQHLSRWMLIHLSVIEGKKTTELGLLCHNVAYQFHYLYLRMGAYNFSIYLKTCRVCLYRALAAMSRCPRWKRGDSKEFSQHYSPSGKLVPVSLSRSGLPRLILPIHRRLMIKNDERAILMARRYTTIFSFYKYICIRKAVDVSSVVETTRFRSAIWKNRYWLPWIKNFKVLKSEYEGSKPPLFGASLGSKFSKISQLSNTMLRQDISRFVKDDPDEYIPTTNKIKWFDVQKSKGGPFANPKLWLSYISEDTLDIPIEVGYRPKHIWSSSPTTQPNVAASAMICEEAKISLDTAGFRSFKTEPTPDLAILFRKARYTVRRGKDPSIGSDFGIRTQQLKYWQDFMSSVAYGSFRVPRNLHLGKVGLKVEPAGKNRLFMIADYWTQSLMTPFHDWIYKILRLIHEDGTFEQLRPFKHLMKVRAPMYYSIDLTAATDKLPKTLQTCILDNLLGRRLTKCWLDVSFKRFYIPQHIPVLYHEDYLIFRTGTPLGVKSYWGIFALTHHFLVQEAAYRCTKAKRWYSNYCLLGDDLVIGDQKVALKFKSLLNRYRVKVSLMKSIISYSQSAEFASRFVYRGIDVSPISFAAYSAVRSWPFMAYSYCLRIQEYRDIKFKDFLLVMGAGYRVRGYNFNFSCLRKLPKRWLRAWLIWHVPEGPHGLPWDIWLQAGRRCYVSPYAIGVLHGRLWEFFQRKLSEREWVLSSEVESVTHEHSEAIVKVPFVKEYIKILDDVMSCLCVGDIIGAYLAYYEPKSDFVRSSPRREVFRSQRTGLKVIKIYEMLGRILSKPVPLAVK